MGTVRFFEAPGVWSRIFKRKKAEPKAETKESYLMLARTGLLIPGIAIFRTENLQCRSAALITPSTNLFS